MKATPTGYKYLVRIPGVRGGNTIVEGTRIGVHDVIAVLQSSETVETITRDCFPDLTRAQVYECLAYYEEHREEIDPLVAVQFGGPAPEDLALSEMIRSNEVRNHRQAANRERAISPRS